MKCNEYYFFEEVQKRQLLFRLTGAEFNIGEYDCMITQVSADEETATIIIMPVPGGNYFEGGKIEVGLK